MLWGIIVFLVLQLAWACVQKKLHLAVQWIVGVGFMHLGFLTSICKVWEMIMPDIANTPLQPEHWTVIILCQTCFKTLDHRNFKNIAE